MGGAWSCSAPRHRRPARGVPRRCRHPPGSVATAISSLKTEFVHRVALTTKVFAHRRPSPESSATTGSVATTIAATGLQSSSNRRLEPSSHPARGSVRTGLYDRSTAPQPGSGVPTVRPPQLCQTPPARRLLLGQFFFAWLVGGGPREVDRQRKWGDEGGHGDHLIRGRPGTPESRGAGRVRGPTAA